MNHLVTQGMFWPFSSTGGYEWLIVLAVAVLLFGKRLPELGRMIGRTLVNFRHGVSEMKDEITRATDTAPPPSTPHAPPPASVADPVIPTTEETPNDPAPASASPSASDRPDNDAPPTASKES